MLEELQKTSDIDPSGLFSTYKSHPTESDETVEGEMSHFNTVIRPAIVTKEQKVNTESNNIKALRIIIDGGVRMTHVAVWSIAVFGGLFITALATNTIDRAVAIINTNIGTHISLSGEVAVKEVTLPQESQTPGITSSTLPNPTTNVPDTLASKRRAILEAKKAAKLLEEKQKVLEQSL